MIIRPLSMHDCPTICLLERHNLTGSWSEAMVQGELANNHSLGFLAVCNDKASGFILARLVADEGEIIRLAVASGQRRHGIGSSLLHALLDELKELRAGYCFLEVRAGNIPALGLYDKMGFTRAGLRKRYYQNPTEDGLILQKDLLAELLPARSSK